MLRAMLDSHPSVAVPHEAYFVVPALQRRAGYERAAGLDRAWLLADLARDRTFTRWELDPGRVQAIAGDETLRTVPDVLAALYRAYADQAGKARFADKTPRNVLHVELLAAAFPDARFVHLIRDGRDVVPSLVGLEYFPDHFAEAAVYWSARVRTGRRAGRMLGPGRYHEVRYEELVADPEAALRVLCDFLELPYAASMLEYHRRADDVVAAVSELGHHQGLWRPPTRGVRDWRASMSPHDQQLFEVLAGSTLDEFGYERSAAAPSWSAHAEGLVWLGRLRLRGRARRVRARVLGAWGSVSG